MSSKISHVDDHSLELSSMEQGSHHFTRDDHHPEHPNNTASFWSSFNVACILQRLLAEAMGTYFIVFTGCGAIIVDKLNGSVTYVGVCVSWGLIIMIVVYNLEHITAHFNPAVTLTYAVLRDFPWKEVPLYIMAQLVGSILASLTLSLLLDYSPKTYFGTVPSGSNLQALMMEIIIGFILGFVIFGVAFDERAHKEFAGIVIGMTILMNALVAGSISGASMNPARSIGPAVVRNVYKGLWVYVVGPTVGIFGGGAAYTLIKFMNQLPTAYHDHKLPFQRLYHH
ncbi:hypothetical protein V2J09_013315 [Rumex salicifolius]